MTMVPELPTVGARHTITRRLTAADEAAFVALSGDRNPLHIDDAFAQQHGFNRRLSHGLLVTAAVLPAIGALLPARGFVCLTQQMRFHRPVHVDETLQVAVEIKHVTPALGVAVVGMTVHGEDGALALSGEVQTRLLA